MCSSFATRQSQRHNTLSRQALLAKNAKVYIATRNKEKSLAAIEELRKDHGKEAYFLPLDLSDLKSVKSSAEEFLR